MQKLINSQSERLQKGDSNQQYLIFTRVRAADLAKIDDVRSSLGKHTRMAYYTDIDELIIKLMPSAKHEKANRSLGENLFSNWIGWECWKVHMTMLVRNDLKALLLLKRVIQPTNLYLPEEETKTGQQSSLNLVYLSPYGDSESMQDGGLRILEVM